LSIQMQNQFLLPHFPNHLKQRLHPRVQSQCSSSNFYAFFLNASQNIRLNSLNPPADFNHFQRSIAPPVDCVAF
jgi:hypothetical protein